MSEMVREDGLKKSTDIYAFLGGGCAALWAIWYAVFRLQIPFIRSYILGYIRVNGVLLLAICAAIVVLFLWKKKLAAVIVVGALFLKIVFFGVSAPAIFTSVLSFAIYVAIAVVPFMRKKGLAAVIVAGVLFLGEFYCRVLTIVEIASVQSYIAVWWGILYTLSAAGLFVLTLFRCVPALKKKSAWTGWFMFVPAALMFLGYMISICASSEPYQLTDFLGAILNIATHLFFAVWVNDGWGTGGKKPANLPLRNCANCGATLAQTDTFCTQCGQQMPPPALVRGREDTVATLTKVFLILGCISIGWALIPLAWCLPLTISVFHSFRDRRPVSTGTKVCVLLFVNMIAGILLLVMPDEPDMPQSVPYPPYTREPVSPVPVISAPENQQLVADQLKMYKELLDSGVITQVEFDEKKKQILGL